MRIDCPIAASAATRSSPISATPPCTRPTTRPPRRPTMPPSARWHRLRLPARQPRRRASRAVAARRRLPRLARGDARHRDPRDPAASRMRARGRRPRRIATAGARVMVGRPRTLTGEQAPRLSGGLVDRSADPRASRFDGRGLSRPSRRHAGLGAAGQRRQAGRPLVQVSSAARHPHSRAGGAERAWSSCAAARGASPTPAPPSPSSTMGWKPRARTAGRRWAST